MLFGQFALDVTDYSAKISSQSLQLFLRSLHLPCECEVPVLCLMKSLNPFDLQQRIQGKLRGIFKRLR